jgi:hypothetical protein
MLIPLPNITYDIQEAIDYYNEVKEKFQNLKITKQESFELLEMPDRQKKERVSRFLDFVKHAEPYVSWPEDKIIKFTIERGLEFTKNAHFWYIKFDQGNVKNSKITQQKELRFGFAKKILDVFPNASIVELVVNPVGTKYHKHVDGDDWIRIVIPIIADNGAVWHFNDVQNVTQLPGHAYLVLTEYPHATDVFGPNERVSIHLQLKSEDREWVSALTARI